MEDLRTRIRDCKFVDEAQRMRALLEDYPLAGIEDLVEERATRLVESVRARRAEHTLLDRFLQEYGLENDEGVALMCLAEALLRVPDSETMDALIKDKILPANWADHLGDSSSLLVNASTWGLMLTGRVIAMESWPGRTPGEFVGQLISRLGEPVIRAAMHQAMEILGQEFVLGRTIDEAMRRGGRGSLFSFDMLGEAARTAATAEHYFGLYEQAIEAVGAAEQAQSSRSGISVKLSALHPRYEFAQWHRVMTELQPRLMALCRRAAAHDIALSVDAEEADRLELSLELFEAVARSRELSGWDGLGLVVQAYGKRSHPLIDWIDELARQTRRRINVRLVKGAYWDAEIKRAQQLGYPDFPVFTVKWNTDVAYLAGARRLLGADRQHLYPQFATHNAHTVAAVMALAGDHRDFEFQRLHGMGELLYRMAAADYEDFPDVRVYAPVGGHEDLLPYLVRRLLENGANSSFVNRFLDDSAPAASVVQDPGRQAGQSATCRHPRVLLPGDLYGGSRPNSHGWDLADEHEVSRLQGLMQPFLHGTLGPSPSSRNATLTVINPADHGDVLGAVEVPDDGAIDRAMALASAAQRGWDALGGAGRAEILRRAADLLIANRAELMALVVREAGKTIADALSEVREAEDFCRYYATLAERHFDKPVTLPGPTGETNELSLHGRGVFVCISPWNFPLAIFMGQVAGALLAGNSVVAKPAEQTPFVARRAVELLLEAGVPDDVLHLLPGTGKVGARLVRSPLAAGVAFTGGTETGRAINRGLAERPGAIVPLIAETGGQNVMLVDSTALLDQVADDVIHSAFHSAGQRCSALRVLLLQEEIADKALKLIVGAMNELRLGNPAELATDVGPIIDDEALAQLRSHIEECRRAGMRVHAAAVDVPERGTFLAPHVIEIDSLNDLTEEHFGPVLHVQRFAAGTLDQQLDGIRALGYGLTMGMHSRIEQRVGEVFEGSIAGNTYVNRNMVGAVVGVQPFGGFGLSGTGPKAGGPHYLHRFATERTLTVNTTAQGGNVELMRNP